MNPKRGTVLVVLLTVLFVIGAGCLGSGGGNGDTTTTAADGFTLEGDIDDARSGDGVSGVTVTVDGRTAETDSDGEFAIEGLSEGEYTVLAEKPGYLPTEISVGVSSDRQVAFTIRDEEFYQPDQASLVQTHWENDVTCQTCHGSPEGEIEEPPADSTCMDCHPMETIENQTAEFDPNPHDDPHGRAQDCGSCHKVHEPSVNGCTGCHSQSIIPDPP